MEIWRRPFVAFIAAFCSTMGINALSNATDLLAGHFQASLSEISPATSLYLIAEIAALPLMPVVVARLGVPRLLQIALWGFLAGSVICLLAPSLNLLLAGRVVQGFFGGMLVMTPLLIMKSDLPPDKQPLAMTLAGFSAGFAPVVGPLVTASLTAESVQMIFLLMSAMIVTGLIVLPSTPKDGVDSTKSQSVPSFSVQNVGAVILFSLGLASIVWAVEHLQQWGGWADQKFRMHFFIGVAAIMIATMHQWGRQGALLPLYILAKSKYIGILLSSIMMGVVVYGFIYLVPYYLIRVHGAGVQELFHVTLYASIPQLLWLPVVLYLRNRLSPYALVTLGAMVGVVSVWQLTGLGLDFGGSAWLVPQGLRAIAIPMIVLPLSLLLVNLPTKEDAPGLTSLYGLCRTLGGVIGVSGLTAYTEAQQSHYAQIIMTQLNGVNDVNTSEVERNAWLYAFNDTFTLVSIAMVAMLLYFGYLAWQHFEGERRESVAC